MIPILIRKELLDILRDRRTIITNILAPLLLFPIVIFAIQAVGESAMKEARERTLNVAAITHGKAALLRDMILARGDLLTREGEFRIREDLTLPQARALIESDDLDAAIYLDRDFDRLMDAGLPARVSFYYKQTDEGKEERQRLLRILEQYSDLMYEARVQSVGVDPRLVLHPLEINHFNLASDKERFAFVVAAVVPYLFVIFSLIGCMHPATDLSAGEKERGTLETLLTVPATRLQILAAKFVAVFLNGLFAAGISIAGLYAAFRFFAEGATKIHQAVSALVEPQVVVLVLALLLPITVLFAALFLTIGIYAKSYKEAQSMLGPAMMVIILPLYVGVIPGQKLSHFTAAIPLMNVSLAIKEIVAGSIVPSMLVITYASLIVTAGIALAACTLMFRRESAVFRS